MASETHYDKKPRLLPTPNGDFYQITACLSAAERTKLHIHAHCGQSHYRLQRFRVRQW